MKARAFLSALLVFLGISVTWAQESDTIRINYDGKGCQVTTSTNNVKIQREGAHVNVSSPSSAIPIVVFLTGSTSDGCFMLDGDRPCTVCLNGLNMVCTSGGCIGLGGKQANKIIVAEGSNNHLVDSPYGEQKACLYSKGDLLVDGGGLLTVTGHHQHAVASKHSIHLTPDTGTISLTCSADGGKGIKAGDSLVIDGGTLSVEVTGNTIVEMTDGMPDTTKVAALKADSAIVIRSGHLTLTSTGLAGRCVCTDGTVTLGIPTGYAMEQADTCQLTIQCINTGETFGDEPTSDVDTQCKPKGIKADGEIVIHNGLLILRTTQDGAEGLESKTSITVNNGVIDAVCQDDCINTSGFIVVNGGLLHCVSTGNDAIDTNLRDIEAAALTLNGGTILAFSSGGRHEEGIDVNRSVITINGGYLFSIGGQQGGVEPKVKGKHPAAYVRRVDTEPNRYYTLTANGQPLMTILMPCKPTGDFLLIAANGLMRGVQCQLQESMMPPAGAQQVMDEGLWLGAKPEQATRVYHWTQGARYVKADASVANNVDNITWEETPKDNTYCYTLDGKRVNEPKHGTYVQHTVMPNGHSESHIIIK